MNKANMVLNLSAIGALMQGMAYSGGLRSAGDRKIRGMGKAFKSTRKFRNKRARKARARNR